MPATARSQVQGRVEPESGRTRILDAAELLFADGGYHNATMRKIAEAAGAPFSLITHHFGTKEELFRQVIDRRIHAQIDAMKADLAKAKRRAGGGAISVEDYIRAYVGPMIHLSANGGDGWKNYARLLGISMNNRHYDRFLEPMISNYDPIAAVFTEELRGIFPGADDKKIHWSMYFLHATILQVLVEGCMVERQSDGLCKPGDLMEILEEMVPFFAAGFRARLGSRSLGLASPG